MMKVYKISGEAYELKEEPIVYATKELALKALEEWEDFLGMSSAEALDTEEAYIETWSFEGDKK